MFSKMNISRKAALLTWGLIFFLVGYVSVVGYRNVWNMRYMSIGDSRVTMAKLIAQLIADKYSEETDNLENHTKMLRWQEAVASANAGYEGQTPEASQSRMEQIDKEWIASDQNSEIVSRVLSQPLSHELKVLAAEDSEIAEIFVTDQYGGLVAASNRTSDYFQADEAWWQQAYNQGKGAVFLGPLEFDESSGKMSSSLVFPIRDEQGAVRGICKAVIAVEPFFARMKNFSFGQTGHAALLDGEGGVIFYPGAAPQKKKFPEWGTLEKLLTGPKALGYGIVAREGHLDKKFVALAKIESPLFRDSGLSWTVLIIQSEQEFFFPLINIVRKILFWLLLLIGILIPFTRVVLFRTFIRPVLEIKKAGQHFAAGKLDYQIHLQNQDELGSVAESLNHMSLRLRETMVSREKLEREIESRKHIENSLVDRELKYSSLFTSMSEGVAVHELLRGAQGQAVDYRMTDVNPAFERITGIARETAMGGLASEVYKTDQAPFLERYARVVETNQPESFEAEFAPMGKVFNISVFSPGGRRFVTVFEDITERKRVQRELEDAASDWGIFFDAMADGVSLHAPDYTIINVNQTLCNILGKSREELIGKKCFHVFHQKSAPVGSCPIERSRQTRQKEYAEIFEPTFNKWLAVSTSPILDGAGQVIRLIHVVRDIAERKENEQKLKKAREDEATANDVLTKMLEDNSQIRKQLEISLEKLKSAQEQLIHAEKMEAVGRMASGIAHEVKNPLGIIMQGINYFEKDLPPEKKDSHAILAMMKGGIQRANGIIRALLDFSRREELKIEPFDINVVIEKAVEFMQHKFKMNQIEIVCELGKDMPAALVDKGKIEQVFVNLFDNAVDVMRQGGRITVRSYVTVLQASDEKTGNRATDVFKFGDKVIIVEVQDTGTGIDANIGGKIFDPFFTTKDRSAGAGLGLPVSKGILDMHRSLIRFESEKDKGTKFIITFRLS